MRYRAVYPGIDLIYYGNQHQLEYDFVVAPGADPNAIRLRFPGAKGVHLTPDGDLEIASTAGTIAFRKPTFYQAANGQRVPVPGSFRPLGRQAFGFRPGPYDRTKPLIVDPVLVYSTYLGGSASDIATAITTDAEGNVYIAGGATSPDFPVTPGTFQTNNNSRTGNPTAFVAKLNPAGTALLYSTYLGGSTFDLAYSLAIDSSGNAYIAGSTSSSDFPTTKAAFQTAYNEAAGFITKLNPAGSALAYSTYFPGAVRALAVDSAGNAYIAGNSFETSIPVTLGAFQPISKACCGPFIGSPFVTKINPTGSALVYSIYLGGSGICEFSFGPQQYAGDAANALAVDNAGNAYIAGATSSADFPVTPGVLQTKNKAFHYDNGNICPGAPGYNAFVTKLNPTGTALVYSTYVGGTVRDFANSLAVDNSGNVSIAGLTSSADFPVTSGAIQTANHSGVGGNAFITTLNPNGSSLLYSTYLGGSRTDSASELAVDASGNVSIAGTASSTDFPVTSGAFQPANRSTGPGTAFFTLLNQAGAGLLYSTYLGGTGSDAANALALDTSGNAWIAGSTSSTNFPATGGALQTANRSASLGSNAFVAKLALGAALPAPSITPGRMVPIYSNLNVIQPGEWVSIMGANLAGAAMISNGAFPTSLGGVSVTINGKAAYLIYVSPTQINLQAPDDATTGPVSVVVTTPAGKAASTVTLAQFAPSFCLFDETHVAGIILRPDGSGTQGGGTYDILGPTGDSLGLPDGCRQGGRHR